MLMQFLHNDILYLMYVQWLYHCVDVYVCIEQVYSLQITDVWNSKHTVEPSHYCTLYELGYYSPLICEWNRSVKNLNLKLDFLAPC